MDIILLYMLFFSDYKIGVLSISDWALIILLLKGLVHNPVIRIEKNQGNALILILIGICLSTVFNINKTYFDVSSFVETVGKFLLYVFGIYLVPQYFINEHIDIEKHLKYFLFAAVLGGGIQKIIVAVLGRGSWPLFSLGGHFFGLTTDTTMFNNVGMMRARSFWSEPAHFAIFISLLFALIIFNEREKKTSKVYFVLYALGIVLANSMSGYGVMVAIVILYFVEIKDINKMKKGFLGAVVAGGALYFLISSNELLMSRISNLLILKDNSGVVRTVGGWHFLKYVPFWGVGIGNNANYYKSLSGLSSLWFSGSGEFYNNILLSIITMGYIGALGYLSLQYFILKDNKKLFLALMVTHFGWGKLFTTPVWIFLIIYISLKEYNNNMTIGGNEND